VLFSTLSGSAVCSIIHRPFSLETKYRKSMEMSFFAWNMGMSFFGMPLAQTWLARTRYHDKDAILVTNEKGSSQRRARAGLIYS
jgi:hypothetical protein